MQRLRLQGREIMACLDRRRLLQLSGAGAVAASAGGLAAILAAGRAPAYAQGTTLHWLRWADFVPASDQLLRNQIAPAVARCAPPAAPGTSEPTYRASRVSLC